ncbi:MAG: ZIP family metal transporter [Candidatus Binatia bacterium]|nr:ZIP family metal transporter [Candidatus Binatia bacterium]
MPTPFQWFSLFVIVLATMGGGWAPLSRPRDQTKEAEGYPLGEAFAAGIFLALSLTMMLPASYTLLARALPGLNFPIASLIAIVSMLVLLGLTHMIRHLEEDLETDASQGASPIVPVIMTVMIAIPSFFLGAVLGVSDTKQALLILIAILLHKTSAAFALALKLSESSLARSRARIVFGFFVSATPIGILAGSFAGSELAANAVILARGVLLAMAAGTFLFMGTLNELQSTPMIRRCRHWRGFTAMLLGLGLTTAARWLLGEAHSLG